HQLWASRTGALWERANIRPGDSVLDVGAGPGFATFDLARVVGPRGRVVAVDEAEMYVEHLRAQTRARGVEHVDVRRADVQRLRDALHEGERFDAAYARWVLCFVRDPQAVIAQAAEALKPGGRLVVQDYFNYSAFALAPKREAFTR